MRDFRTDPTEPRTFASRFRIGSGPVRTWLFVVGLSVLLHVGFEVVFLERRGPVCEALGLAPSASCAFCICEDVMCEDS